MGNAKWEMKIAASALKIKGFSANSISHFQLPISHSTRQIPMYGGGLNSYKISLETLLRFRVSMGMELCRLHAAAPGWYVPTRRDRGGLCLSGYAHP